MLLKFACHDAAVESVHNYKYLGTILDYKLVHKNHSISSHQQQN